MYIRLDIFTSKFQTF